MITLAVLYLQVYRIQVRLSSEARMKLDHKWFLESANAWRMSMWDHVQHYEICKDHSSFKSCQTSLFADTQSVNHHVVLCFSKAICFI